MNLEGKIVMVTGANGGVGSALVKALLNKGAAKVYAAARTIAGVKEFAQFNTEKIVAVRLTSPLQPVCRRPLNNARI